MKTLTKFSLTALMGITSLMSSVGTVVAQENNFPNKSLTYIVPFLSLDLLMYLDAFSQRH